MISNFPQSTPKLNSQLIFNRTLKKFIKAPAESLIVENHILTDLIFGCNNLNWSAHDEFLLSCIRNSILYKHKPIFECGSGLTTIIVGIIAKSTGNTLWTMEHSEYWGGKIQRILNKYKIDSVHIFINPLKDYGTYYWYDPPLNIFPNKFGLVICDGPPGSIKGGRFGLLPEMKSRLAKGSLILLDDVKRNGERAIADQMGKRTGS